MAASLALASHSIFGNLFKQLPKSVVMLGNWKPGILQWQFIILVLCLHKLSGLIRPPFHPRICVCRCKVVYISVKVYLTVSTSRNLFLLSSPFQQLQFYFHFPPPCTSQHYWIPAIWASAQYVCEHACSVYERVLLCTVRACVCECFRVVKLAETARAAHRFSRLHYSSPSEEWLRTMLAKWTRLTLFLPYSQCLYYHAIASLFPLTSQFYPHFNCSYMPSVMSLSRKHHDDHSGVHV